MTFSCAPSRSFSTPLRAVQLVVREVLPAEPRPGESGRRAVREKVPEDVDGIGQLNRAVVIRIGGIIRRRLRHAKPRHVAERQIG